MNTALLIILGATLAALFASIQWQMQRINDRLDRIEARLGSIEVAAARNDQRLDDHVGHPLTH